MTDSPPAAPRRAALTRVARALGRWLPVISVLLLWLFGAVGLWRDADSARRNDRQNFRSERELGLDQKADELIRLFETIEQSLRNIGGLPGLADHLDASGTVDPGIRDLIARLWQPLAQQQGVAALFLLGDSDHAAVMMIDRGSLPGLAARPGARQLLREPATAAALEAEMRRLRERARGRTEATTRSPLLASPVVPVLALDPRSRDPERDRQAMLLALPLRHDDGRFSLVAALLAGTELEARLIGWPFLPGNDAEWRRLHDLGLNLARRPWSYRLQQSDLVVDLFDRRDEDLAAGRDVGDGLRLRRQLPLTADARWHLQLLAPASYLAQRQAALWQGMLWRQAGLAALCLVLTALLWRHARVQRRHAAELERSANVDELTGLPNRFCLLQRLKQACQAGATSGQRLGLILLDPHGFRHINETLGHGAGDAMLQQVAERLRQLIDQVRGSLPQALAGRLDSDQFLLICPAIDDAGALGRLAQALQQAFEAPLALQNQVVDCRVHLGLVLFPDQAHSADDALRKVHWAVEQAKLERNGRFVIYDQRLDQQTQRRLRLLADLQEALPRRQFELHFQPELDLADRRLVASEALLRWRHPDLGPISPAEFIPLLEHSGLIVPVGSWVLEAACRQVQDWRQRGVPMACVAVNVSLIQINQPGFVDRLVDLLEELRLPPGALTLEITESVLMNNPQETVRRLNEVRAIGVRIAIDDFGTGYSSLSYVRQLPVHVLKIDRSFVNDSGHAAGQAILHAVSFLARGLELGVVAEGVETTDQLQRLNQVGGGVVQGYLLSRPLPPAALEVFAGGFEYQRWLQEIGLAPSA